MDAGRLTALCCIAVLAVYLSFKDINEKCYLTKGDIVYKIGTRQIGEVLAVGEDCSVLVQYKTGRLSLKPEDPYHFKILEKL